MLAHEGLPSQSHHMCRLNFLRHITRERRAFKSIVVSPFGNQDPLLCSSNKKYSTGTSGPSTRSERRGGRYIRCPFTQSSDPCRLTTPPPSQGLRIRGPCIGHHVFSSKGEHLRTLLHSHRARVRGQRKSGELNGWSSCNPSQSGRISGLNFTSFRWTA